MKVVWPKSVTIRAALITGFFVVIAALITHPWNFEDRKPRELKFQVLDLVTHRGIEGIFVSISPLGIEGVTDGDGYFDLVVFDEKTELTISMSKHGYQDTTINIALDSLNLRCIFIKNAIQEYGTVEIGPN